MKLNQLDWKPLLELNEWAEATAATRHTIALAIAEVLPTLFDFTGLNTYSLGKQSHEIATYRYKDSSFALIPGCAKAQLGYDRLNPFKPSPPQEAEWQFTQEEFGITLDEYLGDYLTPLRMVKMHPFLAETTSSRFDCSLQGNDLAKCCEAIQAKMGEGFRLPTTDEWEYMCAGGARELFRWGNDCPISNSYEEKVWNLHKLPNAFGLIMSSSTYDLEMCEAGRLRGGDGGSSVCGGLGDVASWLPFASSFYVPDEEVSNNWLVDEVFVRRLHPIQTR